MKSLTKEQTRIFHPLIGLLFFKKHFFKTTSLQSLMFKDIFQLNVLLLLLLNKFVNQLSMSDGAYLVDWDEDRRSCVGDGDSRVPQPTVWPFAAPEASERDDWRLWDVADGVVKPAFNGCFWNWSCSSLELFDKRHPISLFGTVNNMWFPFEC